MKPILFGLMAFILMPSLSVHANECDAVLIPAISAFEQDTRTTLDTLSVIQTNSAEDKSTRDKYAVTVPIYGVPVEFGYQNENSSSFRSSTLNYFKQNFAKDESISYLMSDVSNDKAQHWADCMQQHSEFMAYFNKKTITPDRATLYVRRFITGSPRKSHINLNVDGGTIGGKAQVDKLTNANGDFPFNVNRKHNARLTVEATMDNGAPSTAVVPAVLPPPKLPTVSIRAWGNLQLATVDKTFPHQFHFQVDKGVRFASNQVTLHLEEWVDGKICQTRTITSADLGDNMSSTRKWRLDEMKAGCQMDAVPVATSVECFVDPLYFTQC